MSGDDAVKDSAMRTTLVVIKQRKGIKNISKDQSPTSLPLIKLSKKQLTMLTLGGLNSLALNHLKKPTLYKKG